MTVWIVEGESVVTPGRPVSVHSTQAGADAKACDLVNALREELDLLPDATPANWRDRLAKVTALTDGAAYVEMSSHEVQS